MSKPQIALYTKALNPLLASLKQNATINYANSKKIRQSIIKLFKFQATQFW